MRIGGARGSAQGLGIGGGDYKLRGHGTILRQTRGGRKITAP